MRMSPNLIAALTAVGMIAGVPLLPPLLPPDVMPADRSTPAGAAPIARCGGVARRRRHGRRRSQRATAQQVVD